MSWLARLAERQIAKTRAAGGLQGLAGEGRPLPDRPGDAFVSAADAAAFRIMAEAGALPDEIVLGRALDRARAALAQTPDDRTAQALVADLDLRRAIAAEARRRFLKD